MFENLKSEWQREAMGGRSRLRLYVAALLLLGAAIFGLYAAPDGDDEAAAVLTGRTPVTTLDPPVSVDPARLPDDDDEARHARFHAEGLGYLLSIAERVALDDVRRLTPEALAALPFAEARGGVFEVSGLVDAVESQVYPDDDGRLWSIVLSDAGGAQVVVLRQARASEFREGHPDDALEGSTELIEVGDRLLARGVYLQRRTGTIGSTILRDPMPVLVATPPRRAFRKLADPAAPIADLAEADWDAIADRFLADTKNLDEPALFQVLQWARRRGHEQILADIRSGALPSEHWDQDTFVTRWELEVDATTDDEPRSFTEGARGRLFWTEGLLGNYVINGWEATPRIASRWDIGEIYLVDLISDHYGNVALRMFTPFPLDSFPGVTTTKAERLRIYGLFLKNHTYETRRPAAEGEEVNLVTVPFFIALHIEVDELEESPYRFLIWIISGAILVLAVLFYVVLIRGERKEADRMQAYRRGLRQRIRARAAGKEVQEAPRPTEADEAEPPPPEDEAGDGAEES
ncbi:MAG: hypothetical protein ACYTG6_07190 [Planctomycetota bacterium]|jgi:hypothetical protein